MIKFYKSDPAKNFFSGGQQARLFKGALTFLFLLIIQVLHASSGKNLNDSNEWVLLKDTVGVKVYYKIDACKKTVTPDPLNVEQLSTEQSFQLKFVNQDAAGKSITLSEITRTEGKSELKTLRITSGTTLLSCDESPKIILTKAQHDSFPSSVVDFLKNFKLIINN